MKVKIAPRSGKQKHDYLFKYLSMDSEKEFKELQVKYKKQISDQNFKLKPGKKLILKDDCVELYVLKSQSSQDIRNAAAGALNRAKELHLSSPAIDFLTDDVEPAIEGLLLADYQFSAYKKRKESSVGSFEVLVTKVTTGIKEAQKKAERVVDGVLEARDLVNMPAKDMQPQDLAREARAIARGSERISTKVLSKAQCEKLGMGSYLSVAAGAESPPAFIHMTYKPKKKAKKKIAIVGKGVTFDSGGLSIKPSNGMMTMKCDMGGSAAVLGLFKVLAGLDLDIEVHGIVAATENMINGKATRPGDVVRAMDGQTIEVLNTDAEGRLTLADAMLYAQQQKVDEIVDLATLTGACVVALGEEVAALYSNNDEAAKTIIESGEIAGEEIWQMPLHEKYDELLESEIADVRNIAKSRYGGSITAALFLKRFIKDDIKWTHIDIAGPAFAERPINAYSKYGATGFGVMTLVNYLEKLCK